MLESEDIARLGEEDVTPDGVKRAQNIIRSRGMDPKVIAGWAATKGDTPLTLGALFLAGDIAPELMHGVLMIVNHQEEKRWSRVANARNRLGAYEAAENAYMLSLIFAERRDHHRERIFELGFAVKKSRT